MPPAPSRDSGSAATERRLQSSTGPMCRRRTRSTPTPHRVRTGAGRPDSGGTERRSALHPGEVDARTRDKGALHVQVPRSRPLFTAARGPGHPLGRTGVAQRPGAFTPAGRHAAWSVSWRRRHRSAEVLGTTRRSLRPPGGTPAAVVTAFGGDRCRVLRLARRSERLRLTR